MRADGRPGSGIVRRGTDGKISSHTIALPNSLRSSVLLWCSCARGHRVRSGLGANRTVFGLADGANLAEFRAPASLARLLVILALPKFFLYPTAFEQFLEAPQRQTDRLAI